MRLSHKSLDLAELVRAAHELISEQPDGYCRDPEHLSALCVALTARVRPVRPGYI